MTSSSSAAPSPFTAITDPREASKVLHPLETVLTIAICSIMAGGDGWEDMEHFGHCKQKVLSRFIDLSAGVPKHDVYRRLLCRIDPEAFRSAFLVWVRSKIGTLLMKHVAIDGKTLRGSGNTMTGENPLHMVSAWASEHRMVIGQVVTLEKSNEITAIPLLLRSIPLVGTLITTDAMGCQWAIADQICDGKGDYCFCLKGNQSGLHDDIREMYEEARAHGFAALPHDVLTTKEKNRGRHETRTVRVVTDVSWLVERHPKWAHIRSYCIVERIRQCPGDKDPHREIHFYISSTTGSAEYFGTIIRNHWHIENTLHWTLDMTFNEDASQINDRRGAENIAILRHLALSILKRDTTQKASIKKKRKMAGWSDDVLINFLAQI